MTSTSELSELRKQIGAAIFDPGATEGLKGERTLTEWQSDAVMRVIDALRASERAAGREKMREQAAAVADNAPCQTAGDRRRADAIAAAIRAIGEKP